MGRIRASLAICVAPILVGLVVPSVAYAQTPRVTSHCAGLPDGEYIPEEGGDPVSVACSERSITVREKNYVARYDQSLDGTFKYRTRGQIFILRPRNRAFDAMIADQTNSTTTFIFAGTDRLRDGTYRVSGWGNVLLTHLGASIVLDGDGKYRKFTKLVDGAYYEMGQGKLVAIKLIDDTTAEIYRTSSGERLAMLNRIGGRDIFDRQVQARQDAEREAFRQAELESQRELDAMVATAQSDLTPNALDVLRGAEADARREAEASERQFQRTLARAERQAREEARSSPQGSTAPSSGDRIVAQEQVRAEQLRQEREARAAEERRVADAEAGARRQREEQARRDAEAARTRPVEWIEGVVLCEPRANSKQWRCMGPLQTNVLELDAPNTFAQLALACGGDSGIREIGPTGGYRAYGCGFGIHPTASNYPGNRDVPKDLGVFVSDRRVFRCPPTKDAYCRTP